MKCVILAAGNGTRMRPLTLAVPKAMLPIGGKPIVGHILDALPEAITEAIIVIGYLGSQIRRHVTNRYRHMAARYVVQKEALGTYHALSLAAPFLGNERFLVVYADDLYGRSSLERCVKFPGHCVLVTEVPDPRRFGVVVIDGEGNIEDIEEKPDEPRSNLAYCGPAVLSADIFRYAPDMNKRGEYFLTDAIAKMIKDVPVGVVRADFWFPIGYPEDLEKAEKIISLSPHDGVHRA